MKIDAIRLSVFETPSNTGQFDMVQIGLGTRRHWERRGHAGRRTELHVLHVHTDEGIEGVCTVGDARYTTMRPQDLEQLRILVVGQNPFDREFLHEKLHLATRGMFAKQGWYGTFDNCLWDIAGKAAGLPVVALMGRARLQCSAYYNIGGGSGPEAEAQAVEDTAKALSLGFPAVKDHFRDTAERNIALCEAVRRAAGPDIEIMHDAAMADYNYYEALRVGRALQDLDFAWFEEPLQETSQASLQELCRHLDIPVLGPETMMHDVDLSAQWLISGAVDWLRANGRHGATTMLKLAHLAELHDARIEFNGPGGLFGLVHAHLVCAVRNTSYYEYFPSGSRDEAGKQIGLLNPPVPANGYIAPPEKPGWGAEWDWDYFRKVRVAEL